VEIYLSVVPARLGIWFFHLFFFSDKH